MCKMNCLIYLLVWSFWIEPQYTEHRNISNFKEFGQDPKKEGKAIFEATEDVDGWSVIVLLATV